MHLHNGVNQEKMKKSQGKTEYFEQDKMQKMQDSFMKANHVYCSFVKRDMERVTEFTSDEEEENFISTLFPVEMQRELVASFSDVEGENIIEMPGKQPYVLNCGVAVRGKKGEFLGAWLMFGIDFQQIPEDVFIPAKILRTGREAFDNAIALMEVILHHYFTNKSQLESLKGDVNSLEKGEKQMLDRLEKTEVLTNVLRMMESEDSFSEVVTNILDVTGNYLKVSNCSLMKVGADNEKVELVCEWAKEETFRLTPVFGEPKKEEVPFMTGRPYTISPDTITPKPFTDFFAKYGIVCGAFLPISISGKMGMYLCFMFMEQGRKWSVEDVHFMNDIKCVVQSILAKRVTTNSLASSYSALESILENTGCGVSVIDLKSGTSLYINETYKAMDLGKADIAELEEVLLQEQQDKKPIEFYAKESNRWFELSFSSMHWVDERPVRLVTIYDISKNKQYQEKIERQANLDYLTGLYNRKRLEEDFAAESQKVVRSGGECAVLVLDLDDFGNINDGLGHQAGDLLLKKVAQALQDIDGIENCCYRVGGDEFVVLIRGRQIDRMESVIASIQRIFTKPWYLEGATYYCTMSMGVVKIPKDGVEPEILMQRADIALHAAKSLGKNRVEYYDAKQLSSAVKRLDLEKSLREAVERGCQEFEVYYQPLIDVTKPNNPCCGAEALVRWNSPTMGFVMPSQFIPLAEYLGLINQIGEHVLLEACKRCKYWNDFGHPEYKVNVNLSVVQLVQNNIIDVIRNAVETTEINPKNLTLEVTEGLAINDMKRMQYVLGEIKNMGVRVALDDFGTGYSSLNHIRSMPIDVIKIDRCFVEDIGENAFSDTFVKSVSQIADALNMHICVEGVEDQKQRDVLGEMNIDMIQGYLYDKPLAVDEFENKYLF